MVEMQHEVQILSFMADTKDHKTLRNAIANGINAGVFGFRAEEDGSDIFYKWRLRGDIVEINDIDLSNDEWEILNEENYNTKFNKGVYGKQIDWSVHQRYLPYVNP